MTRPASFGGGEQRRRDFEARLRSCSRSHRPVWALAGSFGVLYGLTSCVALPAVLRWNEGVANDRRKLVAALLGNPKLSTLDAVRALAHALESPSLTGRTKMVPPHPTDLAAIGIGPGQFHAIAEHTRRPLEPPSDQGSGRDHRNFGTGVGHARRPIVKNVPC